MLTKRVLQVFEKLCFWKWYIMSLKNPIKNHIFIFRFLIKTENHVIGITKQKIQITYKNSKKIWKLEMQKSEKNGYW